MYYSQVMRNFVAPYIRVGPKENKWHLITLRPRAEVIVKLLASSKRRVPPRRNQSGVDLHETLMPNEAERIETCGKPCLLG